MKGWVLHSTLDKWWYASYSRKSVELNRHNEATHANLFCYNLCNCIRVEVEVHVVGKKLHTAAHDWSMKMTFDCIFLLEHRFEPIYSQIRWANMPSSQIQRQNKWVVTRLCSQYPGPWKTEGLMNLYRSQWYHSACEAKTNTVPDNCLDWWIDTLCWSGWATEMKSNKQRPSVKWP